jgi:two-component SAPR family response regulator
MTEITSWGKAPSIAVPDRVAIADCVRAERVAGGLGSRESTRAPSGLLSRIRIYTLGSFCIVKDDEPLAFEGKMQRKPLELLKVLIALGGQHVAGDRLIGNLWPETLEDGGHKALEIAIHRLRKLLDQRSAIVVSDRHLSLDPRCVWVDALWLDQQLAAALASECRSSADWDTMEGSAVRVLELYRGHFLANDVDEPWQIPLRNRLCGRLQRLVVRIGQHYEEMRLWQRAADLYQRVIELDPLAETFYRRQIVCLNRLGQRVEAIEVFRRLRHTLSVLLGVAPNADTIAVHAQSWCQTDSAPSVQRSEVRGAA